MRQQHLHYTSTTTSCSKILSSVVAKPELAVMPLVAVTSLETTPSLPTALLKRFAFSGSHSNVNIKMNKTKTMQETDLRPSSKSCNCC